MTATVHDFNRSLARSHKQSENDAFWEAVYRSAFPTFQGMTYLRDDGLAQRSGVDRHISLANGRAIRVDEKVRSADYNDFCLEYWSVFRGTGNAANKPGWVAQDLACDFIAYAFPSRRVYLLPWPQLRSAWRKHRDAWVAKYRKVEAVNGTYVTLSVAVPIAVVLDAISEATLVEVPESEAA